MLSRMLRDGLLALGTFFMPPLLIGVAICAMAAWQPGTEPAATLALLCAAFISVCWALWAYLTAPWRVRGWFFLLAAFINAVFGVGVIVQHDPHSVEIAAVYLVCSLWQFFVFRRRYNNRSH